MRIVIDTKSRKMRKSEWRIKAQLIYPRDAGFVHIELSPSRASSEG